jgi:hypothetical protein
MTKKISRRDFLGLLGAGTAATTALLTGCKNKQEEQLVAEYVNQVEPPVDKMTMRTNPTSGDKVSLLGYGMMRLPTKGGASTREDETGIDQEQVNKLVDYAIAHGVNYFDTSPVYCKGNSEESTGIALSRHKRSEYFVATKLSNMKEENWTAEASKKMYHDSFKKLQVDYIDYYLLHSVGMKGMDALRGRYLDNGILDFLLEERKAGRIRNLGFSYHGDIEVFDYLLSMHDKYHWDFVQIELNYLDWHYAKEINPRNTNAEYLYGELQKRHIPSVIMEPLLGGRLANIPQYLVKELKKSNPEASVASWAFRYAGTPEGVLTVLSGMTYMEHLKDNLLTYSPLKPVTKKENALLEEIARQIVKTEMIPCNDCKYCMPCPYGVDIPGIFVHYNKCKNEGTLPVDAGSAEYRRYRREYLIGLDRAVEKVRQPQHCIGCGHCEPLCPQRIHIPRELQKIDEFINQLKREAT